MTALMVAANGGHLSQLVELADRMDGLEHDRLWVTFDSPQSRTLLDGRNRLFVPPVEERDIVGAARDLVYAHRLIRDHNVTAVVSTGSGVALSFLPYAALRGIPAHYVESAARVGALSLTGRLLAMVPGVKLYVQYPHLAHGRWQFIGSVFDGFRAEDAVHPRPLRRIVVTLGSGVHAFRRMVDRLIAILPAEVEVFWQTGSTPIAGLPIAGVARPIVFAAELDAAIRDADAVIAHAGCGSALAALNAGKYPILVPRESRHDELVDDHQVEVARFLAGRDLALHRTPEGLTLEDIAAAAARRTARRVHPPALKLVA
jgi:UDP-N-acetylglucosamine--N-acetylmuramyl-(pentapeptide) pyrophosphoryl-undecaprenol N-acetylglucosamine transferase